MEKKVWLAPEVIVHGSVETITQKTDAKFRGTGDDLFSQGATPWQSVSLNP